MSSAKSVAQPLLDTEKYIRMLSSDLARIFRRSTNPEFRQGLLDLVDATDSASFEHLFDASLRSVYAPGNSQDANVRNENVAASITSIAPVAVNDGFVEINDDADVVMPNLQCEQEEAVERVIAEVSENSSSKLRLDSVTPELEKQADELVAAILDGIPAIASQPTSFSDHQLSFPGLSIAQYSSDILTPRTTHRLFNFASDSENDENEQTNVIVNRHDSQLRRQQPAFSDYSENSQSTTSSCSSGFSAKTTRIASFSVSENRQTSSHSFRQWHSFDDSEASGSNQKSVFESRPLSPSFSFADSNNFASLNLELEFSPGPMKSFGNQMALPKSVASQYANANVSGSEHATSYAGWFSPSPLRSCFSFGTHGGSFGPSLLTSSSVPSPTAWRPPLKVCKNERQPQASQGPTSNNNRKKNNANLPASTTFTKRKSHMDFSSSEDEN